MPRVIPEKRLKAAPGTVKAKGSYHDMRNYFRKLFEVFEEAYKEEHHHHSTLEEIEMRLQELLEINVSFAGQLSKIEAEILVKRDELHATIAALTAQLASVELTPEQAQSVADVQAAIDRLDAIVPDPIVEEPAPVDPGV